MRLCRATAPTERAPRRNRPGAPGRPSHCARPRSSSTETAAKVPACGARERTSSAAPCFSARLESLAQRAVAGRRRRSKDAPAPGATCFFSDFALSTFALRAPFQLVVDGPDFFGDEGAVLLITSLPLLELPLPLEERSLVDEGEHLFERDVFDYARAVEGRARDGRVRVHVRARRVRSVADDGARGARAGGAAHAELRVFADEFFRLVRRGVGPLAARPGFRRRGLAVLRRRAVARAALQGVHDVQAVEGVLRVEERAFVERLQIFINVAAVERGPAENDGHTNAALGHQLKVLLHHER